MTGPVETAHEVQTTASVTPAVPAIRGVGGKLVDLWPAMTVGFGIVLTVAWTGGLSWLLVSLLLLVV